MKLFVGLIAIGLLLDARAAIAQVRLQGGGATFPNLLYQRWLGELQKRNSQFQIDYQAIGSGGGVKGITEKTLEFAGSDAPLSAKELAALGGPDKIVQIPTTCGGVVVATNVPGVASLKLSGSVIADLFLGKISNWNDPQITALNVGMALPDLPVTPVYRTDGSGTTFVFTNYLMTQSDDFRDAVGFGKQVRWPLGQGGKGTDGVTAVIQQTPGAIGYIEQAYADQNQLQGVAIQNAAGQFVKAAPATVTAAGAASAGKMSGSVLAANIWNASGEQAYPIASFTYLIVYRNLDNLPTREKAEAVVKLLDYALGDGQPLCEPMDYAPLPPAVLAKARAAVKLITFHGAALADNSAMN